jgi:glycosyltransferase involved in cell wall biosynthesis
VDTNIFKPVNVYENYFLTVCRIERLKRLELTIGAFNIFRKLYRQKFRLVVAGYLDPQNKSYLNHLTHICPKDVEFVINPRDEDLLELYQKAYAFVFSSLKEPFGLTPLEAMSCGKPIIATGQGGFVDYLIHGQNGFIVSSNPYAIAKKMLTLAENYELTFSLGEGARKTALSYDWEIFTKRMDNLVEQIVNK